MKLTTVTRAKGKGNHSPPEKEGTDEIAITMLHIISYRRDGATVQEKEKVLKKLKKPFTI